MMGHVHSSKMGKLLKQVKLWPVDVKTVHKLLMFINLHEKKFTQVLSTTYSGQNSGIYAIQR